MSAAASEKCSNGVWTFFVTGWRCVPQQANSFFTQVGHVCGAFLRGEGWLEEVWRRDPKCHIVCHYCSAEEMHRGTEDEVKKHACLRWTK